MGRLLQCEPFVRHRYLGHPSARLQLLLDSQGRILATLGTEDVPMRILGVRHEVAVASNTFSLQPGALAFLIREWMKASAFGAILPTATRWNEIVGRQSRWQSVPGLRTWYLNWGYPVEASDPWWKRLAKPPARLLARIDPARQVRRIPSGTLRVEETDVHTADMCPRTDVFDLRPDFDPDVLNWRFSTKLDYVRYRVFRIMRDAHTCGGVVLAEWPGRVVVSHFDCDDPADLACGVLLAVSAVNRGEARFRQVVLNSIDPTMNALFHRFGFRSNGADSPFHLAAFGSAQLALPPGGRYLVPIELGDQGIALSLLDTRGPAGLRADARLSA